MCNSCIIHNTSINILYICIVNNKTIDKYRQCNLNFEVLCENYGEMSVGDAIMICDKNEFLKYLQDEEQVDYL